MERWDDTFIYALCDPDTNEPMYVGQTNKPRLRLYQHVSDTLLKNLTATPKQKWIRRLLDQDKRPVMVILEMFPYPCETEDVNKSERHWIRLHGKLNSIQPKRI